MRFGAIQFGWEQFSAKTILEKLNLLKKPKETSQILTVRKKKEGDNGGYPSGIKIKNSQGCNPIQQFRLGGTGFALSMTSTPCPSLIPDEQNPFILQTLIKHLLCTKHYSKCWDYSIGQDRVLLPWSPHSLE